MVTSKKNARYFVYAVLVHLVFVGLLVVSLHWTAPRDAAVAPQEIVQAVTVDESRVQKELEKIKQAEDKKRREDEARKKKLEDQARQAQEKRKQEEQRLADLKQKREQERQQALQEEKQRKAEAEKLKKAQAEEKQRLAELQKKKEAEAQRVRELEEKRQREEDEARRKAIEEDMKAAAAKEAEALAARQSRIVQGEMEKYTALIRQKVSGNWLQPTNFQDGSSCVVLVKVLPTGDVIDVRVTKCTGGALFQRSVESAVRKASPLPMSPDPAVYNKMREIEFTFKPEIST